MISLVLKTLLFISGFAVPLMHQQFSCYEIGFDLLLLTDEDLLDVVVVPFLRAILESF